MGLSWDKATLVQNKPKGQTNQGSFSSNPYQNPQMGSFGGAPQGWGNQNSAMYGWGMGFAPPQSAWQGDAPGRAGQDYSYNPMTGQGGWMNTAGGVQIGGSNPYGSGAITWTDPITGMKSINPDAIKKLLASFGGGGGGGYESYTPSEYGGAPITAPEAYGGGDWDVAKNVVNVHDVIESYRPTMEAEIAAGFANAGNRLGQSGFAMSTPYAGKLGEVEALARAKMNQRGLEFEYDAGKFDAGNQMATMMAKNAEALRAWETSGGWDMGAQSQNAQNAFNQWMAQNQWGFQDNQGQNAWNQNQQNQQQQWLAALLGGLL